MPGTWRTRVLAAVAMGFLSLMPRASGAVVAEGQKFGDWVARCQTPPGATHHQCAIAQRAVTKDQHRQILVISVGFFGKDRKPVAILIVPLGVFLPAGLTLDIPGSTPARIVFDVCVQAGCRAALALTPDTIAAMKRAQKGQVTIQNARRQPVNVPVSFQGFTAGFDALSN